MNTVNLKSNTTDDLLNAMVSATNLRFRERVRRVLIQRAMTEAADVCYPCDREAYLEAAALPQIKEIVERWWSMDTAARDSLDLIDGRLGALVLEAL